MENFSNRLRPAYSHANTRTWLHYHLKNSFTTKIVRKNNFRIGTCHYIYLITDVTINNSTNKINNPHSLFLCLHWAINTINVYLCKIIGYKTEGQALL